MTRDLLKDKAVYLARHFMMEPDGFYKKLETACEGLSTKDAFLLVQMAQIYYNYLSGMITAEQGKEQIGRVCYVA